MRTNQAIVLNLRYSETSAMMFFVFAVTTLFSFAGKVSAAAACESKVAQIASIQGIVELRHAGQTIWQQAAMDMALCPGDMLRVRARGRAALRLNNDSMLRLDQKTTITFPELTEDKTVSLVNLFTGALHILTRTPKPFKIRTPFINAAVEGTEFSVSVDQDSTQLVIFEGQVSASNNKGSLVLVDHEAAIARKNEAPQKVAIISPTDAVQWALYYPTIIDAAQLNEQFLSEAARPQLQEPVTHYQQGRFFEALVKLEEVPQQARTAPFLIFYASLLLIHARVDEAQIAIEQALRLKPGSSAAYALQAIIAVVKNDKNQALNLANRAVELNPMSATAKLALSYAQQAHFEIEQTLASVQEAVQIDTQNASSWARLAELQMSTGHLDHALDSARQAVNLNPTLAKTQTVLGFAHLLQIDTQAAKTFFTQAIALDQADPMPRLGMGLALIREGDLEAGRIALEIAVSLDPANSLIRSYLGKAYFEEKRYPLASTQFDTAKERDPYDPTPWFYDAIQKQTQNRPMEALQDIQKSIELNNNRAVYRSKLLLDQDQAGRGSSLARIYDNLGFEKRALMETAKSLSFDPANHSAHRFLSDAYTNIPRHEIARVSELLQAQLLQPINVNPVQPSLAVADMNIITNTGPTVAGFNEFAPLMERNRPQLVASGIVGNQGTLGNELVFSQLYDRTSVSLGQFHHETNGFRPNNDQKHNIYNAFIQHAFTPKFNVQAEVRTRESKFGDLILDGDPKRDFEPDKKFAIKQDSARIGARYALSPQQDVIASFIYTGRKEDQFSLVEVTTREIKPFKQRLNEVGYLAEFQHLFRHELFNTIIGFNTYQMDADLQTQFSQNEPNISNFTKEQHKSYLYATINSLERINTTLGFSYNSYEGEQNVEIIKFSPKFGLQVDITKNLRLRLAWFETVKSALIANQTLEPTQVAGFNQLFDDINGTKARRKGVGLDAFISQNLYAGVEASTRNLSRPIFGEIFEKQKEELYQAYFYWLPKKNWSIRGETQYEKYTRKDTSLLASLNEPTQIVNLRLPLGINYFNQQGFLAKLTGTYVLQDIKRREGHTLKAGTHDFFMLDMSIGYRLLKRKGLVSFEARNLLDQNFIYQSYNFQFNDYVVSRFIPERTFFARLTLNF